MIRAMRRVAAATALALVLTGGTASAQKAGGILRVYSAESPPGLNIYEQATPWGQGPLMGVYNNLILFDQHEARSGRSSSSSGSHANSVARSRAAATHGASAKSACSMTASSRRSPRTALRPTARRGVTASCNAKRPDRPHLPLSARLREGGPRRSATGG
jgi:hypothetical protein